MININYKYERERKKKNNFFFINLFDFYLITELRLN